MSKILLFHGCMNRFITPQVSETTLKILKDANIDFESLDRELCCGFVLYENGQHAAAVEVMKKNQELFSEYDIDTILTSCPTCAYIFKIHYPEHLPDWNYKVVHMTEFLAKLIDEKKLNIDKKPAVTVTFHDPCHLTRGLKITEEPRSVLNAIPGLKLVEMEHSREASKCCGAGSGMRLSFSSIAQAFAENRIAEAEKTGATILVTACPTCMLHLQENAKNIKVIDISEAIVD
ncbi:(Fe-S)-binding protein [Candidatus Borrarchaeum sp.]|uniref:(Fe-S)-binding protein n=1 Tax=Candidatus Borrarchaeum sp. TaxID=2846742 RepID=UPI00257F531E|nr:(Fe-S)-binding protein [Candidatus Borrarchaeum sp.]